MRGICRSACRYPHEPTHRRAPGVRAGVYSTRPTTSSPTELLMIRRFVFSTVAVLAGSSLVAVAAPKDDVTDAAKKLSDAQNYSWKANTEAQGGGGGGGGGRMGGPTEGMTEKGGFTVLKMTRGDNEIVVVRKGEKGAVKTQDGWQSFEELQADQGQGGQGGQGRGRFMGRMLRNFKAPAEEAADLASKSKEITKAD